MGHRDGVVGTVVYNNRRRVAVCGVADFLSKCAVSLSHQRHPGRVLGNRGKADVRVAALSVLREAGDQNPTSGFSLGRVLSVPAALGLLRPHLRGNGVQVGDVDEGRVPLLLLCSREVQAEQLDEAEGQQPGPHSQTAAGSEEGRSHGSADGWTDRWRVQR